MEQHPAQPNWEQSMTRFHEYVKKNCELEILDPGDPDTSKSAKTRPFMPLDRIQAYFERQNFSELRALLACLYPSDPVNPKTIFPKYIAVFCTLLFAGRGKYIKHFTRFDNLSDTALPFDPKNPPANQPFTAGDPDFWTDFCKEQWRFCTPILEDPISDKHFETERVLPIIYKERLAGGGSANLWLVKIYPFYNKIIPDDTKAVSLMRSPILRFVQIIRVRLLTVGSVWEKSMRIPSYSKNILRSMLKPTMTTKPQLST